MPGTATGQASKAAPGLRPSEHHNLTWLLNVESSRRSAGVSPRRGSQQKGARTRRRTGPYSAGASARRGSQQRLQHSMSAHHPAAPGLRPRRGSQRHVPATPTPLRRAAPGPRPRRGSQLQPRAWASARGSLGSAGTSAPARITTGSRRGLAARTVAAPGLRPGEDHNYHDPVPVDADGQQHRDSGPGEDHNLIAATECASSAGAAPGASAPARITTDVLGHSDYQGTSSAGSFGPGEDHNFEQSDVAAAHPAAATELRPRRGSQPLGDQPGRRRDPEQRRDLGPGEDHNQLGIGREFIVTFVWRPSSAAAEDHNIDTTQVWNDLISSSAGTPTRGEDRLSEVMTRYFW